MKYVLLASILGLAACAEPITKANGPDFGYGDYFETQHEFSSWVQVGCYEEGVRLPATRCD